MALRGGRLHQQARVPLVAYYREYRGYEVHLQETVKNASDTTPECVSWKVVGFGSVRSTGSSECRQDAYHAACAAIDELESDPHRFPVNLVGYPEDPKGDVVTRDGEFLGQWRMSGHEALVFIDFIPVGSNEVLFCEHFIGILCSNIREWHDRISRQ